MCSTLGAIGLTPAKRRLVAVVEADGRLVDSSRRRRPLLGLSRAAADETGDRDYTRVSSHDLRRCWAQHLLVEQQISPRIVMSLGGWSSYDAIEPYLAAPTEDNIIESMSGVGP